MKFSKKYIAAGSAVIVSLSLCAYALNQHRSQENKDNNRVSYVDGSQSSQKSENLTPDQVSQKEGIQAEQIVIKISDQGYVTSHVITIITIMGKFLMMRFSVKNS